MIGPGPRIARVMAPNLMDARRRDEVLAGAYAQGLEIGGLKTAAGVERRRGRRLTTVERRAVRGWIRA